MDYLNYGLIMTRIFINLKAVIVLNKTTSHGIKILHDKTNWYDANLDRSGNKDRMKEFGGALSTASDYLQETTILFLYRTIEDVIFDLEQLEDVKFSTNELQNFMYFKEAREIKLLSHVVRHNTGYVLNDGGSASNALIKEYGYHNQQYVGRMKFDYELKTFQVFNHCHAILSHLYKVDNSKIINTDQSKFIESLYPAYFNLE